MARIKYLLIISLTIIMSVFTNCTKMSESLYEGPINENIVHFKIDVPEEALVFWSNAEKEEIYRETMFSSSVYVIHNNKDFYDDDAEISLHGESSLLQPRKSFFIDLKGEADICGTGIKHNKIFLLAMEEDIGYFKNYLSLNILKEINLVYNDMNYISLTINNEFQGLYLCIERSQDAIYRHHDEIASVFRRNYEPMWFARGDIKDQPLLRDTLENVLYTIPEIARTYQGTELQDKLENVINLDQYFNWLAMNKLLNNGDYTDEIFAYSFNDNPKYFHFSAWDYEDVFMEPHGNIYKENSLVYSTEYVLDSVIANDSILYQMYEYNLKELLSSKITDELLKDKCEYIYQTIPEYFTYSEISDINNNFIDYSTTTNENPNNVLEKLIDSKCKELYNRRDSILQVLNDL